MSRWVHHGSYGWRHRPWWKVAINTVLRIVQPWVRRKWVIYTRCVELDQLHPELVSEAARAGPPVVLGYGFGRIDHGGER